MHSLQNNQVGGASLNAHFEKLSQVGGAEFHKK